MEKKPQKQGQLRGKRKPKQHYSTLQCQASVCSSGFVSSQQRFGVTDIKALSESQLWGLERTVLQLLDKSVLQLSVTALFYLEDSRKIHLRGLRARRSKDTRRRVPQSTGERESQLWLLYLYVYFSLGLPYVNWASQECSLFHLRSSPRSSDLLLFYFHGLFPSLSFSHRHFRLLFPILPT